MCVFSLLLSQDLEQQRYIYTKGCVGQFEKWLQDNLIVVAGVFVGIALLQVSRPACRLGICRGVRPAFLQITCIRALDSKLPPAGCCVCRQTICFAVAFDE